MGSVRESQRETSLNLIGAIIPPMAWRTRCYECGQEVPITRPLYGKQSVLAEGDLGHAIATYEAHPRRPADTRSCSAVSTTVPQYQMGKAH